MTERDNRHSDGTDEKHRRITYPIGSTPTHNNHPNGYTHPLIRSWKSGAGGLGYAQCSMFAKLHGSISYPSKNENQSFYSTAMKEQENKTQRQTFTSMLLLSAREERMELSTMEQVPAVLCFFNCSIH
ncbi:hypothetical protein KQX54_009053 [Cotesia glomerata]|uniref:Uncharacterized protein n=1 Tax=Cotesia glomerata TaxID=32391 RepID=A0AAV7IZM3_COTGL|nr:hypothetical protein KQX54_009053 [Cotesia glomerata]